MEQADISAYAERPIPQSCRLLDFDKSDLRPGFVNGTYILTVKGDKPSTNVEVTLRPLIYVRQPEYWGWEVVGCLDGIGLPVITPYSLASEIGANRGTRGIEVIGANRSERHDIR